MTLYLYIIVRKKQKIEWQIIQISNNFVFLNGNYYTLNYEFKFEDKENSNAETKIQSNS